MRREHGFCEIAFPDRRAPGYNDQIDVVRKLTRQSLQRGEIIPRKPARNNLAPSMLDHCAKRRSDRIGDSIGGFMRRTRRYKFIARRQDRHAWLPIDRQMLRIRGRRGD